MRNWRVGLLVIFGLIVIGRILTGCGSVVEEPTTTTTSTSLPDTAPPTLISVSPSDEATRVAINTEVTATFSEDMDSSTINNTTFTLFGSQVTGTVSYDAAAKTAIFTPESNLSMYTTYVATIAAEVKDPSGNALGTAHSWSFRTVADATAPTAGSPSINSGAASTESRSVTVSLTATDNVGIVAYYLSEHSTPISAGDARWVSVTPTANYSADVSFSLSSGGGTKQVYAWFKDADRNVSSTVSDRIFLASVYKIWDATYDSGGNDYARGMAVDGSGNVYVTGYSGTFPNQDYTTVRYDSDGNEAWNVTYDGGDADRAYGIAVNGSGNAYVTGVSQIGGDLDYTTIKYNLSGGVTWIAIYEGGSNEYARGIAVDGSGNVYVTGVSNNNYYTIKYDASNGSELSNKTYDGGSYDDAYGVAVDGAGNVYVAGESDNGTDNDYCTIKYDSGWNIVWIATYESGSYDYAYGIALDGSGNVYVTGYIEAASNNIVTIKYNVNGNEIWAVTYDGGGDDVGYGIAVDGSGNVYVAGESDNGTDQDYYIVKYDTNGNEIWAVTYDSGGNDSAYGIAVDGSRNVYVTGISNNDYYTIKYGQN